MFSFKRFILENWFEKNDNTHLKRRVSFSQQLSTSKTPDESGAIERFIKNSKPVNKSLLSGKDHPDVKIIDRVVDKNRLPVDLHAYSSLTFDPKTKIDNKNEMRLPAYLSMTPHKDVAKDYATKDKNGVHHIAHIELKKGQPATYVGTHEDELILGRDQTMHYHGSVDVEDGDKKYRIHKMSVK
jgi:hypothetical protein